jgi:hypothetical protein
MSGVSYSLGCGTKKSPPIAEGTLGRQELGPSALLSIRLNSGFVLVESVSIPAGPSALVKLPSEALLVTED